MADTDFLQIVFLFLICGNECNSYTQKILIMSVAYNILLEI